MLQYAIPVQPVDVYSSSLRMPQITLRKPRSSRRLLLA